jgi:hypothetical protein
VGAAARVGAARDAILAESIKKRQRRDDARAASTTRSLSSRPSSATIGRARALPVCGR